MPKGAIGFSATQKATDIARNSVTKRIPGMPGEALALEYRPKPSPNKPTRWPLLGAAYHRLRLIETLAWTSAHDERRDIGKLHTPLSCRAPKLKSAQLEMASPRAHGLITGSVITGRLCPTLRGVFFLCQFDSPLQTALASMLRC